MSNNDIFELDSLCEGDALEGDIVLGMIDEDVVYPEEFLPTYHSIKEGATIKKALLSEFNDKPDSLFFNDGVRRIDFILAYEDEDKKDFEKRHTFQRRKRRREYFEASLMKMGMELEAIKSVSRVNFSEGF
ncbi:Anoctamin-6 [Liparis tanakae]|uniref:Anoctamin-6 n=1 Tax=Liparis tanakae TaxID=230148 RepID=A0A4Z2ID73_9TELE|nr:Anoctamin-6 [Liparis tanakae]